MPLKQKKASQTKPDRLVIQICVENIALYNVEYIVITIL